MLGWGWNRRTSQALRVCLNWAQGLGRLLVRRTWRGEGLRYQRSVELWATGRGCLCAQGAGCLPLSCRLLYIRILGMTFKSCLIETSLSLKQKTFQPNKPQGPRPAWTRWCMEEHRELGARPRPTV